MFFQGLTGAIGLVSCLASISFMPVPDALCIIFTCPVITIILSAIILGKDRTLSNTENNIGIFQS